MRVPTSRRQFLSAGAHSAALAAAGHFYAVDSIAQERGPYRPLFAPLDKFVERYLREMNAPGMTLVLADRDGIQRVATYGFGDLERNITVDAEQLFQIGSISKSFIGVSLLGLVDERQARSPQTDRRVPALVPRPVRFRADHDASPAHALVGSAGQRRGVSVGPGAEAPGGLRARQVLPLL